MQSPDLRKSILEGAVNSDSKDLTIELSEIALDGLYQEGLAKEFPVLRTVIAAKKTWDSINDRLFLRKVAEFLTACPKFTEAEREQFSKEHLSDAAKARKLGDTIVLILDKLDDLEKPAMLANCFAALLRGQITIEAFRRCAVAVSGGFTDDLKALSKYHGKEREVPFNVLQDLLHTGLSYLASGITIEDIVTPIYTVSELGTTFINCMHQDRHQANSDSSQT